MGVGGDWRTGTEGGSSQDEHWVLLWYMLANRTPIKNTQIKEKLDPVVMVVLFSSHRTSTFINLMFRTKGQSQQFESPTQGGLCPSSCQSRNLLFSTRPLLSEQAKAH